MNFKYKLFAYLFNFFNLLSFKKKNIFFIVDEKINFSGNLEHIENELDKRGSFDYDYLFKNEHSFNSSISIKDKVYNIFNALNFFFIKPYKLAKSKYVFLNDNFLPMAYMNFGENVSIIQLWHAPGAFKKFGLSSETDENIKNLIKLASSKTNYLIVTSNNVSKAYEEAFAIKSDKIKAFGIPRTDYYFDEKYNNKKNVDYIRAEFEKNYPEIKGKKIVLYAPTFRENKELNKKIFSNFDFNLFDSSLGKDYCLFFRAHPKFNTSKVNNSIDVSNYPNLQKLLLISDTLITDYSSIMVEYAILNKPIIFYPFDLEYYISNERGFYFDYKNVPGPIANNTEDIIKFIKNDDFDFEKIKRFVKYQYDFLDNKSSERIVDQIFNKN